MSSIKDNSLHRLLVEFFDLPTNTRSREIRQEFLSNWDSLAMVQLITELERRFSVEFDLEEIYRLRSYAEIRETLSRKGLVFENSATLPG
jgi:acyl carrier protein